jgi:hypothetical protein
MHTFLASLFAALFSFCHASSVQQASNRPVVFTDTGAPGITQYVPTRQEIARMSSPPVYAEGVCSSCRTMNVVYNRR